MAIIIDATVIVSALIRNGLTRLILLNANQRFVAPSFIVKEVLEHKTELISAAKVMPSEFEDNLNKILTRISIKNKIGKKEEALRIIGKIDSDDWPYIALAAYLRGSPAKPTILWSNDKHFIKPTVKSKLGEYNAIVMTTKEINQQKLY